MSSASKTKRKRPPTPNLYDSANPFERAYQWARLLAVRLGRLQTLYQAPEIGEHDARNAVELFYALKLEFEEGQWPMPAVKDSIAKANGNRSVSFGGITEKSTHAVAWVLAYDVMKKVAGIVLADALDETLTFGSPLSLNKYERAAWFTNRLILRWPQFKKDLQTSIPQFDAASLLAKIEKEHDRTHGLRIPDKAPDGPYDAGKFGWKGKSYRIIGGFQWLLLQALFGNGAVADGKVIEHVYGHEHERAEGKLKKLRFDTEATLLKLHLPFYIKPPMSGYLELQQIRDTSKVTPK